MSTEDAILALFLENFRSTCKARPHQDTSIVCNVKEPKMFHVSQATEHCHALVSLKRLKHSVWIRDEREGTLTPTSKTMGATVSKHRKNFTKIWRCKCKLQAGKFVSLYEVMLKLTVKIFSSKVWAGLAITNQPKIVFTLSHLPSSTSQGKVSLGYTLWLQSYCS